VGGLSKARRIRPAWKDKMPLDVALRQAQGRPRWLWCKVSADGVRLLIQGMTRWNGDAKCRSRCRPSSPPGRGSAAAPSQIHITTGHAPFSPCRNSASSTGGANPPGEPSPFTFRNTFPRDIPLFLPVLLPVIVLDLPISPRLRIRVRVRECLPPSWVRPKRTPASVS